LLIILFDKIYPQTIVRNVLPAAGSNAGILPYKSVNHSATHSILHDEGCAWCVLNVKNRLPNGGPTLYKAKCEINFLPGFETVAGDNFDAFIDPAAVTCDTSGCTNPDMITGAPALVKNDKHTNYRLPVSFNAGKPAYDKNYLQQYYLRQTSMYRKYFNDIAGNVK
jgi:hypothetical protein